MYGEGRSAGFEITDRTTDEPLFTMDIDVNRPVPETKMYEIDGLRFCGASPYSMISDKVSVISTDKIFRRVKDVVDLYYASKVIPFNRAGIEYMLRNSKRDIGNFDGFLHRPEDLKHAYEKFRFTGDIEKPPFEEVYRTVRTYIQYILPRERDMDLER